MIKMNKINDDELDAVNGGMMEVKRELRASADNPAGAPASTTSGAQKTMFCDACKMPVTYTEFSGGRIIGSCGHRLS